MFQKEKKKKQDYGTVFYLHPKGAREKHASREGYRTGGREGICQVALERHLLWRQSRESTSIKEGLKKGRKGQKKCNQVPGG